MSDRLDEIAVLIERNTQAVYALGAEKRALLNEKRELIVARATAEHANLVGREVVWVGGPRNPGKLTKGTIGIYDSAKHRGKRGHATDGTLIVIGGKSIEYYFPLKDEWGAA